MKTQSPSVLRASIVIFAFLIGAKVLNFFKKILIGNLFGVSRVADAFFAASYLPYHLGIFFEGVIFLGFLPLFSQVRAEQGKDAAGRFLAEVLILILVLTSGIALAAWWQAPWVMGQLVPGFKTGQQELARGLFQVLSLVAVLISVTSFFKALNSFFEQYALAASAALMDSLVMLVFTLVSWRFWGIYGAAWGSVIGVLTALLMQAVFLGRKEPLCFRNLRLRTPAFQRLFYFFLLIGVIWTLQQIPFVILNRFGSGMWEGTISALTIAQTMTAVPMGLVSHTVLFAVFPTLAKQISGTDLDSANDTFFRTLRGGFLILLPVGLLLTAFARPLAALFFSAGASWQEGTRRIANSLGCFGWATFALYADLFMTQSLIAVRKTAPAIGLCATRALLTYFFGYFLSAWWDYQGLAFSFSLALAVNFFVFFPLIFKGSPFGQGWGALFAYSGKLGLASAPALLIARLVNRWYVSDWVDVPKVFLAFGLAGAAAVFFAFYVFILSRFRIKEIDFLLERLKKGLARRNGWLVQSTGE